MYVQVFMYDGREEMSLPSIHVTLEVTGCHNIIFQLSHFYFKSKSRSWLRNITLDIFSIAFSFAKLIIFVAFGVILNYFWTE